MRIIKKEPWTSWCRLCAKSCGHTVSFSEESDEANLFLSCAQKYLSVRLKENLNFPQRVCSDCNKYVCGFDRFIKRCKNVQSMFEALEQNKEAGVDFDSYRSTYLSEFEKLDPESYEIVELGADALNDDNSSGDSDFGIPEDNVVVEMSDTSCDAWSESKENISVVDSVPIADKPSKTKKESNNTKKKEKSVKNSAKAVKSITKPSESKSKKVKSKTSAPSNSKLKVKKKVGRPKSEDGGSKKKPKKVIKKVVDPLLDDTGPPFDSDNIDNETGDSSGEKSKEASGMNLHFIFQCHVCQEELSNWNALSKHCRTEHDAKAYVDCNCGKRLATRTSIIEHRAKHSRDYSFKCEHCDKSFHRKSLLISHLLSHVPKDEQPFVCCKCARRFHCEALLRNHEKVHLPKEERFVFPCEICHKNFCSKSAVSAHMKAIHFGEKPFVCDQCGNSFASKGILQEHLTVHSDEMPWLCTVCNKRFKTKYRLKVHMDVHRDTPYSCPHCPMQLSTRRTLRMHLVIHRDTKAYQCPTCGKAFRRSKDLKNHKNLHTGEKPYVCQFCSRTFANGSNCRSHKRRMHPEELREYEAAMGIVHAVSSFGSDMQRNTANVEAKGDPLKTSPSRTSPPPSENSKEVKDQSVDSSKEGNSSNNFTLLVPGKSSQYQHLYNRNGPYHQQFGLHNFAVEFPSHEYENSFTAVSYAPAFPGNSFSH